MKLQTLIALGAALIALDAVQASYAASDIYFPAATEQTTQATTELPRATVHSEAVIPSRDLRPTTWHEFGTVWHDETLSNQTRAQVAGEAVQAEHSQAHRDFAY